MNAALLALRLEVWQATGMWWARFRIRGDVTFQTDQGYSRKSDAIRAAEDHAVSLAHVVTYHGLSFDKVYSGASSSEQALRKMIRKSAMEITV